MATKSICAFTLFGLLCATAANANPDDNIRVTIDSAVQNAVQQVLQSVGAAGDQVHSSINQAVNNVAQPIHTASNNFFQQAQQGYRNFGDNLRQGYQTVNQQLLNTVGNLNGQLDVYESQINTILEAYEASFCTPPRFTPSVKKPAKFTGPLFQLSLNAGSCSFNETALLYDNVKELDCVEPSVILTKLPANYTSKYKSAARFVSKECKVEKVFGEVSQKVLYVFDGQQQVDINAIAGTILNEIRSALGTVTSPVTNTITNQFQRFLSSNPLLNMQLPNIPHKHNSLFSMPSLNLPNLPNFGFGNLGGAFGANSILSTTGTIPPTSNSGTNNQ